MKRFFVTGTDTGVGKTYVTAAFARFAAARGHRVFAFKPIETGCAVVDGVRVGADQEEISRAAGDWQRGDLRGVYQLLQPAAPRVAAAAEGVQFDLDRIDAAFRLGSSNADLALVEGAGGWRVPISASLDMGRFARRFDIPVLVVARAGLGTINHALLTLEAIERDGCSLAACILSVTPSDDPQFALSNAAEIQSRCSAPVLCLDESRLSSVAGQLLT